MNIMSEDTKKKEMSLNKRLGPVPPVDPELKKALDNSQPKNGTRTKRPTFLMIQSNGKPPITERLMCMMTPRQFRDTHAMLQAMVKLGALRHAEVWQDPHEVRDYSMVLQMLGGRMQNWMKESGQSALTLVTSLIEQKSES
jgi:hypothetical protein